MLSSPWKHLRLIPLPSLSQSSHRMEVLLVSRVLTHALCYTFQLDVLAHLMWDQCRRSLILSFTSLTGGSDYSGVSFSVTFPAGVNAMSFNVPIINDNIAELAESFTLDLEIPAASAAMGVMKGSPDTATVNIMDDEGELNAPQCSPFPV